MKRLVCCFLGIVVIALVVLLAPDFLGMDNTFKPPELKPWVDVRMATSRIDANMIEKIKFHGPPGQDFTESNPIKIHDLLGWMQNAKTISQIPKSGNWDVSIVLKGKAKKKNIVGPFAIDSRSWISTFGNREFHDYLMRKIQRKK